MRASAFLKRSKKIALDLNQNKNLVHAAFNSAASAGEIGTIEAVRMSTDLSSATDQSMIDNVTRANKGKIKEKGLPPGHELQLGKWQYG